MPGFIAGLDFLQLADPMEPPALLSADHDFRVAPMNSDLYSEIGPCAKICQPPLCEGSGICLRHAMKFLKRPGWVQLSVVKHCGAAAAW